MLILSRRMKSPRPTSVWSAMVVAWVTRVTVVTAGDLTLVLRGRLTPGYWSCGGCAGCNVICARPGSCSVPGVPRLRARWCSLPGQSVPLSSLLISTVSGLVSDDTGRGSESHHAVMAGVIQPTCSTCSRYLDNPERTERTQESQNPSFYNSSIP